MASRYYCNNEFDSLLLGMEPASRHHIRELIERLARVSAADEWADDLNPTQKAALAYLARANQYSRSPSQVAEFLAATRGTVSQTLKALARKGLIGPPLDIVCDHTPWPGHAQRQDGYRRSPG